MATTSRKKQILEFIPAEYLASEVSNHNEGAYAQVVKSFLIIKVGLQVCHSGDKSKPEQAVMARKEYDT